jgi:dihydroxyacetone kinase-like protein
MVDAFAPALDAFGLLVDAGAGIAAAALAAADAADAGAAATVELLARKGRASYLGPRSVGHQDPGATSTALVFRALADVTAPRA